MTLPGPTATEPGAPASPPLLPQHTCKPSTIAGTSAHHAELGTVVVCVCGKSWRVTQNHLGKQGQICGCGWSCIQSIEAAVTSGDAGASDVPTAEVGHGVGDRPVIEP